MGASVWRCPALGRSCSIVSIVAHEGPRPFLITTEYYGVRILSLLLCACRQGFEINNQTGRPLSDKDMMERQHSRMHVLQKVVFEHYRKALPDFPFVSSVAAGKVRVCQVAETGNQKG